MGTTIYFNKVCGKYVRTMSNIKILKWTEDSGKYLKIISIIKILKEDEQG